MQLSSSSQYVVATERMFRWQGACSGDLAAAAHHCGVRAYCACTAWLLAHSSTPLEPAPNLRQGATPSSHVSRLCRRPARGDVSATHPACASDTSCSATAGHEGHTHSAQRPPRLTRGSGACPTRATKLTGPTPRPSLGNRRDSFAVHGARRDTAARPPAASSKAPRLCRLCGFSAASPRLAPNPCQRAPG